VLEPVSRGGWRKHVHESAPAVAGTGRSIPAAADGARVMVAMEGASGVSGERARPSAGGGGASARRAGPVIALAVVAGLAAGHAHAQSGFKVDESFPAPVLPKVEDEAQVLLEADSLTYDSRTETVTATGNATVYYGTYTVRADRIVYNRASDTVVAFGDITITEESGTYVKAGEIELSNQLREGFIYSVTAILSNDARIGAARGIRTGGTVTEFDRAVYTTCKPCAEHPERPLTWQLKADRVRHDQTERIIEYQNVTLELFGVPVFYLPYFSHPDPSVKRKSGFLTPSFASSDYYGFGIRVPYFFNLAPNYDLTFAPLITTRQGPLFDFTFRHRPHASGSYSIRPTFIWQADPAIAPPGDRTFRGSIASVGEFAINDQWSYGWDVVATTDDTYLERFGLGSDTDLVSEVHLTGISERNYMSVKGYHFQGLLASDVDSMAPTVHPALDHNFIFEDPVLDGELSLDTEIVSLTRDAGADSTRVSSDLHWQRSFTGSRGHVITPFLNLRGDVYVVDNLPDPTVAGGARGATSFGRLLPSAGIEASYPLARTDAWGTHVIEPIAQFVIRANESHLPDVANEDALSVNYEVSNLFEPDKFSGIDRYQEGTRASIGGRYTLADHLGGTTTAALGQSYHIAGSNNFAAPSGLASDASDFVASVSYRSADMRLGWRARLDEDDLTTNVNEFSLALTHGAVSVRGAYSFVDATASQLAATDSEEIAGGASYQVHDNWQLSGGATYNIATDTFIRDYVGLEYDDECFGVDLTFSESFFVDRDIEPDQSVRLTVTLKSLGSASISQSLSDAVQPF